MEYLFCRYKPETTSIYRIIFQTLNLLSGPVKLSCTVRRNIVHPLENNEALVELEGNSPRTSTLAKGYAVAILHDQTLNKLREFHVPKDALQSSIPKQLNT